MLHKQQTKILQTVDKNWKQRKTNFHLPVCRIWEGDDDIWKVIKVSKSVFLRLSLSLFLSFSVCLFLRLSLSPSVSFCRCGSLSFFDCLSLFYPFVSVSLSLAFFAALLQLGTRHFFRVTASTRNFFSFSNGLIVSHAGLPSLQPCWINFSPPAVVGWQY